MLILYFVFAVFAESKSINDTNSLGNRTHNVSITAKPDNLSPSTTLLDYIYGKIGAFNGSITILNDTAGMGGNSSRNKLFGATVKRFVADASDFEVPTSTEEQKLPAKGVTEPAMGKVAERVADDIANGMLFGNAFLLDKWMVDEPFGLSSSAVNKKEVRNLTSDFPAANRSGPHLVKRFSLMRKFFFY